MGSSTKKKNEKKKDFQKTKLKVGKARPKNTNATDTSFAAKSIVLKQQNLSESGRDATALFNHNLSLLGSKNDTQRRDALAYLTTICQAESKNLPQPVSAIIAKAQPLILDGSLSVRQNFIKLLKVLPKHELGTMEQLLLYTRAGMTHLSNDIRSSSLDVLDCLLSSATLADGVMICPGGWVKTLRTFQNLLSWHKGASGSSNLGPQSGSWSTSKPSTSLSSNKLLVHQLNTLASFLRAGLSAPPTNKLVVAARAAGLFPLWQTDVHMLPQKSGSFNYLNLFGAPRDVESEVYDDPEERISIFHELELLEIFQHGAKEAKQEAGEVGRAASAVEKALRLAEVG